VVVGGGSVVVGGGSVVVGGGSVVVGGGSVLVGAGVGEGEGPGDGTGDGPGPGFGPGGGSGSFPANEPSPPTRDRTPPLVSSNPEGPSARAIPCSRPSFGEEAAILQRSCRGRIVAGAGSSSFRLDSRLAVRRGQVRLFAVGSGYYIGLGNIGGTPASPPRRWASSIGVRRQLAVRRRLSCAQWPVERHQAPPPQCTSRPRFEQFSDHVWSSHLGLPSPWPRRPSSEPIH
jgi:hypothetical protein